MSAEAKRCEATQTVTTVCNEPFELACPCGSCALRTPIPFCPKCDPERVKKWNKMHGLMVCERAVAAVEVDVAKRNFGGAGDADCG